MTNQRNNLIRFTEVLARVGLCRSRIYQLMDIGKFPKSIKISERAIAWNESDIDDWINKKIEESKTNCYGRRQ